MSQPGHNRRHGNLACSQPQPIFSFSFSFPSFIVSIISSHVHFCYSAADRYHCYCYIILDLDIRSPSSQSPGKHGSISVKSGQQWRFPELRNLLLMSMEPFYTRRAPHTASNETKPTNLKSKENCSNFKNLNTHLNILACFATTKNFALLGLNSTSQKRL